MLAKMHAQDPSHDAKDSTKIDPLLGDRFLSGKRSTVASGTLWAGYSANEPQDQVALSSLHGDNRGLEVFCGRTFEIRKNQGSLGSWSMLYQER